ncbi:MAG: GntR family transcriptional regulator [Acidimicrobiales bacterium]
MTQSSRRRLPAALDPGYAKVEQLQEILEQLAAASKPGTRLPSERELAERYGVARMTARQAMEGLVAKGLGYRVQGQGTFVAEPRIAQPQRLTSFTEDMASRGMRSTSIVLGQEVVPASAAVGRYLGLPAGAPVVRLERLRCGDGEPIALERAHLPAQRFAGLEEADLSEGSLYRLLAERFGCEVAGAEQRIAAVRLTEGEAHVLHAEAGLPAFLIERVTRDVSGRGVEHVRSLYRGDRYEIRTRLERHAEPGGKGGRG